jgi:hypothetical protein
MNENPDLRIFAYDYSPHAVKLVQVGQLMPLCLVILYDPYMNSATLSTKIRR